MVGIEAGVAGRGFMKARGVLGGSALEATANAVSSVVAAGRSVENGRPASSSSVATAAFGDDANQEALTRTQEI